MLFSDNNNSARRALVAQKLANATEGPVLISGLLQKMGFHGDGKWTYVHVTKEKQ